MKNKHTRFTSLLLTMIAFIFSGSFSQETGQISGKVLAESSAESLVGMNVQLLGTKLGISTDLEGNFTIRNVPAGIYDLRVSGVGFAPTVIKGCLVKQGGKLDLTVKMTPETYNMNEMVVEADAVLSSESGLISQKRKSSTINDGVSAEAIKKSPDATSGEVLRRISGISLIDNKFIFIRGTTDRYNETMLDGASVTSTEAGKKSFSFDLIPAGLIEYTNVIKSATPDLSGEFTGGLVQLNTTEIPADRLIKLSLSTSYGSNTHGYDFLGSRGSGTDWIGYDDGNRAFPGDGQNPIETAQRTSNNWAPRVVKPPLNSSFSLSYGDRIDFDTDEASGRRLGFIGALTYKNTYQRKEKYVNDLVNSRVNEGADNEYSVLWGGIANITYKFSNQDKISLKNSFNHSGDDQVRRYMSRQDYGDGEPFLFNYTTVSWTERSTFTSKILGDHKLAWLFDASVQWHGAVSGSERSDPDRKEVAYYRLLNENTSPMTASTNRRSWASMSEKMKNAGFDIIFPAAEAKFKLGALYESRSSDYGIRYFSIPFDYISSRSDSLTHLPLEYIYSQENYGKGKFKFEESSKPTDSYSGDQQIVAGYFMVDAPFSVFGNDFRFAGGARVEKSEQVIEVPKTMAAGGPVETNKLANTDLLPSLNLTYAITDAMNLRLAYSHSVNRPSFREIAPTAFFDFITYEEESGNPRLKRALAKNYDIRFEIFPSAGEYASVSLFHKQIADAIEERLRQSSVRQREFINSENAQNTGWEIDVRKSFGFLGGYLSNLAVGGNYTRVISIVEIYQTVGNSASTQSVKSTRTLQGQSPYTANLILNFVEPTLQASLNLLYNKFGKRLNTVGFQSSHIFEQPRETVDLTLSKQINGFLEAKLSIKNLTDQDRILTRDDKIYERTSIGRTYSLQISLGM